MLQNQARDSMYALPALLALLCILMLASCSTSTSSPANHASPRASRFTYQQYASPINSPVASTGCGQASPIAPGTSGNLTLPVNPAISAGHSSRSYRVHVPAAYNAHQPLTAVLVFHGHGGTAAGMEGGSGFSTLAEQQHFIAVYPQGLPDGYSGEPFWASAGPIDFGIDDVHFVSDMLKDLRKNPHLAEETHDVKDSLGVCFIAYFYVNPGLPLHRSLSPEASWMTAMWHRTIRE